VREKLRRGPNGVASSIRAVVANHDHRAWLRHDLSSGLMMMPRPL
jgi:hypothetical protein